MVRLFAWPILLAIILAAGCGHPTRSAPPAPTTHVASPPMGALLSPPTYPSLPGSTVLQLQIDAGRSFTGSNLTTWLDQSSNAYSFTNGANTGPAVTSTVFQQYDGQLSSSDLYRLSNATAKPWAATTARTYLHVGQLTDAGGNFSPSLRVGTAGKVSAFGEGGAIAYGDGTTNTSYNTIVTTSIHTWTITVTPNNTDIPVLYFDGWQVIKQNSPSNPAGTPGIEGASTGAELLHNSAAGTFYYHGNLEEVISWNSILSASTLAQAWGYEVGRFGIIGQAGWISDAAAMIPQGLSTTEAYTASLAQACVYTTASSFTVTTHNTGSSFSATNLPDVDVFIDGTFNSNIRMAGAAQPTTMVTLSGSPHQVCFWNGVLVQATAGPPIGAIVDSIQDSAGTTKVQAAQTATNSLVVFGYSVSQGIGGTQVYTGAYARFRYTPNTLNAGRVAFVGASSVSLYIWGQFDATYADAATRITANTLNRSGGAGVLFDEMGSNDWGGSGGSPGWASVAAYQTALTTLYTTIHTDDPSATIVSLGPIVRLNQANNNAAATPFSLVDVRNAKSAACAAAGTYCTYVNLDANYAGCGNNTPALTLGDLNGDGVHPTDAGYVKLFTYLNAMGTCIYPGTFGPTGNAIFFGTEASNDENREWGAQHKVDEMLSKILVEANSCSTARTIKEYQ